jgi:hypothetical protein
MSARSPDKLAKAILKAARKASPIAANDLDRPLLNKDNIDQWAKLLGYSEPPALNDQCQKAVDYGVPVNALYMKLWSKIWGAASR